MNELLKSLMARRGLKVIAGADGTEGTGESGAGEAGAGEAGGESKAATPPADGKKGPSDEEARLLKDVMKQKARNGELEAQIKSLRGLESELQALGGIDALKGLVQAQRDAEDKDLEAKGNYEALKNRMAEEHAQALKAATEKQGAVEKALEAALKTIDELTVGTQFGQSQFIKEDLLMPPTKARTIYGPHFDLVGGEVVGFDKPRGAANRTPLVDQFGKYLGFDAALSAIVNADPEKDYLLKAKSKPGANSDSARTSNPPKTEVQMDSMSKISAGLKGLKFPA